MNTHKTARFSLQRVLTFSSLLLSSWLCLALAQAQEQPKIDVGAVGIVAHPSAADFAPDKMGRVMISTLQDKDKTTAYYTTGQTTVGNTPAQTLDGKVTITAQLAPELAGRTVYFKSVDPPDLSPYAAQINKGHDDDNDDAIVKAGTLSAAQAVAVAKTINGKAVAAAEVTLTITNHCSGDNYQVLTSLKPTFPEAETSRSAVLVAWKRVYLELDPMYEKGATLTAGFNADEDTDSDVLNVDNTTDFNIGDDVVIWSRDTISTNSKVVDKTDTTLTVRDIAVPFIPQYGGVRLQNNAEVFGNASRRLITGTYGAATDGSDGGVFIEFKEVEGWNVPKYSSFPTMQIAVAFCKRWYKSFDLRNRFQLVTSIAIQGWGGTSEPASNASTTCGAWGIEASSVAEIVSHENGHLCNRAGLHEFGDSAHVDAYVNARNHNNTDECVMSYNRNRNDEIAEFDVECINHIRVEPNAF